MVLFEHLPPQPSLLELRIPAGTFPGYTIAFNGWTGNTRIPPFWFKKGFQGVHLICAGPDKTIFHAQNSEATFVLGRKCGYIKIENATIKNGSGPGKQKSIFGGVDSANASNLIPYTVHLKNCVLEIARTSDPDGHPEWPIFINQGDVILEDCIIRSANSNEHALYVHGFGKYGAYILNTVIDGVGAEGLKFTARPQWRYYQDPSILAAAKSAYTDGYHPIDQDNWIVVRNTVVKDWNQPWSWRGGAGMTLQGAGLNALIEDCAFVDFGENKPALGIDDSSVEHFGANNVAGIGPANGNLVCRRSIFASGPGPVWLGPVINIGSLINSSDKILASAEFDSCGIYGENMLLSIKGVDQLILNNCNNEIINQLAQTYGIDTSFEARLNYAGQLIPVSHGFHS